MKAMVLRQPRPVEQQPLEETNLPLPEPLPDEVLLQVRTCGVCHTDLHTVEGDLAAPLPVIPGHQAVGIVQHIGSRVSSARLGDRVGVPWLRWTCAECDDCRNGRENLCEQARFNGLHAPGGYAEAMTAKADFVVPIPPGYGDAEAAPLLCAGIIGLRALRRCGVQPGQRLGLVGFGASAHITIQIARRWGCEVFVATRAARHQELARELGAAWTGRAEELPPGVLHGAILFAPAGELVPPSLRALRRGGTLALAGIHMTPIPELPYQALYQERTIRSVANATRQDARELMKEAAAAPLRTEIEVFPLADANRALLALKHSRIRGAAVLQVEGSP